MKALHRIIDHARAQPRRIVLCEADDVRVLQAAQQRARGHCAHPAGGLARRRLPHGAAGGRAAGRHRAGRSGHLPGSGAGGRTACAARRQGMTAEQAQAAVLDPLCFANLMVRAGHADGSVAGALHTTADVVRTALQVIGAAPGCRLVSSFFLMMLCEPFHAPQGGLIFSDCGRRWSTPMRRAVGDRHGGRGQRGRPADGGTARGYAVPSPPAAARATRRWTRWWRPPSARARAAARAGHRWRRAARRGHRRRDRAAQGGAFARGRTCQRTGLSQPWKPATSAASWPSGWWGQGHRPAAAGAAKPANDLAAAAPRTSFT